MVTETSAKSVAPNEIKFLHYLRAIALLLILYDHLLPGAYYTVGKQPPITFIERYLLWPLAIIHHFGEFGVVLFFLVSGFVIVHTTRRDGNIISFFIKRLLRIFPPILFGALSYTLLGWALHAFVLQDGGLHLVMPYFSVNPALWTIKVEIAFYVLFATCLLLYKRNAVAGCLLLLGLCIAICEIGLYVPFLFSIGQVCSYVFYAVLGMCAYYVWSCIEKLALMGPVTIATWFCIVRYNILAYNPERYAADNSFGVSAMYALLFFLVFLLLESFLAGGRFVKLLSRYSFGMYLHHLPMLSLVLLFGSHLGIPVVAMLALLLSVALSYLQVRFVEPGSATLQAKILRRVLK